MQQCISELIETKCATGVVILSLTSGDIRACSRGFKIEDTDIKDLLRAFTIRSSCQQRLKIGDVTFTEIECKSEQSMQGKAEGRNECGGFVARKTNKYIVLSLYDVSCMHPMS